MNPRRRPRRPSPIARVPATVGPLRSLLHWPDRLRSSRAPHRSQWMRQPTPLRRESRRERIRRAGYRARVPGARSDATSVWAPCPMSARQASGIGSSRIPAQATRGPRSPIRSRPARRESDRSRATPKPPTIRPRERRPTTSRETVSPRWTSSSRIRWTNSTTSSGRAFTSSSRFASRSTFRVWPFTRFEVSTLSASSRWTTRGSTRFTPIGDAQADATTAIAMRMGANRTDGSLSLSGLMRAHQNRRFRRRAGIRTEPSAKRHRRPNGRSLRPPRCRRFRFLREAPRARRGCRSVPSSAGPPPKTLGPRHSWPSLPVANVRVTGSNLISCSAYR